MKAIRTSLLAVLLAAAAVAAPGLVSRSTAADAVKVTCPITHQSFVDGKSHPGYVVDGSRVAFCCKNCPAVFAANPEQHLDASRLGKCPVMGGPDHLSSTVRVVLNNELQYFCCGGCDTKFSANPAAYRKSLTDVVTNKSFAPTADSPRSTYKGQIYLFASEANKASFDKSPAKYAVVFGPKPAGAA